MSIFYAFVQGIRRDIFFLQIEAKTYFDAYQNKVIQDYKKQGMDVVIVSEYQVQNFIECFDKEHVDSAVIE